MLQLCFPRATEKSLKPKPQTLGIKIFEDPNHRIASPPEKQEPRRITSRANRDSKLSLAFGAYAFRDLLTIKVLL